MIEFAESRMADKVFEESPWSGEGFWLNLKKCDSNR